MTTKLDERLYELRLYRVAPGRQEDMESRVFDHLSRIFPRNGIHPMAAWSVTSGANLPMFAYITPWRTLEERNQAWSRFYSDPDWHAARNRTNAGGQLVERFEVVFMRALTPWNSDMAAHAGGSIVELMIHEVAVGEPAAVRAALLEHRAPALTRAGASLLGVFEVISGRPLPSAVILASWPNASTREDTTSSRNRTSKQPLLPNTRPVLERADISLMRVLEVEWAGQ